VGRTLDRGALAVADARARRIADYITDGLGLADLGGVLHWASPSLARMIGTNPDDLVGRLAAELVHADDRVPFAEALGVSSAASTRLLLRLEVAAGSAPRQSAGSPGAVLPVADGWRWVEVTFRTASGPDAFIPDEIVLSWRDVHEDYLLYQELSARAERDPLTGVANRDGLDRRLGDLAETRVEVLFLYCDLDGFKAVNDEAGHSAGDDLLRAVASALVNAVRATDIVARVGGDEFAVVVGDPGDVATLGDRVRRGVHAATGGAVTVSIGLAGPTSAADETGFALADRAMYRAKALGRDRWVHLTPDDHMLTGAPLPERRRRPPARDAPDPGDVATRPDTADASDVANAAARPDTADASDDPPDASDDRPDASDAAVGPDDPDVGS
jgi:diguanylate cyclase (GGDEF)-like protein